MTKTTLFIPLAASLLLGTAAYAQSNMDPRQSTNGGMPIDQETSVNGIQAACTGVGDQQENNARWSAYPVKVVVSGTGHQFFSGETVSITGSDGQQVAQMTCNAPWVLMKLQPGAYHATVNLPGHPAKTVAFNAPSRGQREVNVIYRNNELANDTAMPTQHRATDTSYTQPQAKPMDDTTTGNGAVDQPPQQPQ
jgi:hypothetical protein